MCGSSCRRDASPVPYQLGAEDETWGGKRCVGFFFLGRGFSAGGSALQKAGDLEKNGGTGMEMRGKIYFAE